MFFQLLRLFIPLFILISFLALPLQAAFANLTEDEKLRNARMLIQDLYVDSVPQDILQRTTIVDIALLQIRCLR